MKDRISTPFRYFLFATLCLLALCLLFSSCQKKTDSDDGDDGSDYMLIYYEKDDGTFTVSGCSLSRVCDVVIPDKVNGKPVTSISDGAFSGQIHLSSISLSTQVTSIGGWAFENCSNLKTLRASASLTEIGSRAFCGCVSLTEVTFPGKIESVGQDAFKNCRALERVCFDGGVGEIGPRAFFSCSSLRSATLVATVMPGEEEDDLSLSIGASAFHGCEALESVTLPARASAIGTSAFFGCCSLPVIDIPEGVPSLGENTFNECFRLRAISLPSTLQKIGDNCFSECRSLTSLTLPASLSDKNAIGEDAFFRCNKLIEICNASSLTLIPENETSNGGVAYYAKNIYTPDKGESRLRATDDGFLFYEDAAEILLLAYHGDETALTLPSDFEGNPYEVYRFAFVGNDKLTSLDFSSAAITSIGEYACKACTSLREVTLPEGVVNIGRYAFSDCADLQYTVYDNACYLGNAAHPHLVLARANDVHIASCEIHPDTRLIAGGAFAKCASLLSVTVPDGVISLCDSAFNDCRLLENILGCRRVTSIGDSCFASCGRMREWTAPAALESIGTGAFQKCDSLTSITLTGAPLTHIGRLAFSECRTLASCAVPEGVTRLEAGVFYRCTALREISLPSSLQTLNGSSVLDCLSLKKIVYAGTEQSWNKLAAGNITENELLRDYLTRKNIEVICENR